MYFANISTELPLSVINTFKPRLKARILPCFPELFWNKMLYLSEFSKKNRNHSRSDKVLTTSLEGLEETTLGETSLCFQVHCLLAENQSITSEVHRKNSGLPETEKLAKYPIYFPLFLRHLAVIRDHMEKCASFLS